MAKQHLILGLVLGGCLAAVACSSDSDDSSSNGGSGGATAGSAGTHAGGAPSGGSAGKGGTAAGGSSAAGAPITGEGGAPMLNEAGAPGEAGADGEAGAPPVVVVVPPLPFDPNTVLVTSATPTNFTHVLVTATDYATQGEVASVKLSPAAIEDRTVYLDDKGDVASVSSGGLAFVLQRTEDKVHLVNGSKITTTFDMTDPGTDATVDVAHKAYVPLYNKNLISVLDLAAGKVARRVDLSEFNDPNDSDGSVNTIAAVYDSAKKIAYFVLSRIDLGSFDSAFHLPCSATRALVVGVDATTDTILDLNGNADGKGIELSLTSPGFAQLSTDGKTITVLSEGCYIGASLRNQGVELVHLDTLSSTIAYSPTDTAFLADLILLGGQQALIHLEFPDYSEAWNKLDLGTGTLGATLANVPLSPAFDGIDLLGVTIDTVSQAANVVRYVISTDTATTVIASPWAGKYSSAAASALAP
jgi:hypothetical protein